MAEQGGGAGDGDQAIAALSKQLQDSYLGSGRTADLLNLQWHVHEGTSGLMVTVSWTYGSKIKSPDKWKIHIKNLTWEQNDYYYDRHDFTRDGGENKLWLWLQTGNRYKITVFGVGHLKNGRKIVRKKSTEFRIGEGESGRTASATGGAKAAGEGVDGADTEDLLNLQYQVHEGTSGLMGTVSWTDGSKIKSPNEWKIHIKNLTWEQNDYYYDRDVFARDGGENNCELPLWFRAGNRYKITVFGLRDSVSGRKIVCKNSIEFRTGEELSMKDVDRLLQAAIKYIEKKQRYDDNVIEYLYRNKPKAYFDAVFTTWNGIEKTYLKDASGDLRSPINGEICGLFFCANVQYGKPFATSPFGDTRILIRAEEILKLTPHMFFADFYCMKGKQNHYVTIVLTKPGSTADEFCNSHLPRLDENDNPFLRKANGEIRVSSIVFVNVFVTEDLDLNSMMERGVAYRENEITTICFKESTQGGKEGMKIGCKDCDLFSNRPRVDNPNPEKYKLF